jgi:2-C-methyl-D-erythritol 4-phosphate cytidylyltransferase
MDTNSNEKSPAFWCVVPAAGIGSRMGLEFPKQYLKLHDKTILEHTLTRLLLIPGLRGIIVAIHAADSWWPELSIAGDSRIQVVHGGDERCDSVLNALEYLITVADTQDWVLVHDAARPCIALESINRLIESLNGNPVGGILGVPVSDTLKKVKMDLHIQETIDRRTLWQAQTPQMFRLGLLHTCLTTAISQQHAITDEASAVEFCGYSPLILEGRSDNIKITRPDDVALVQFILNQQTVNTGR